MSSWLWDLKDFGRKHTSDLCLLDFFPHASDFQIKSFHMT